MGSFGSWTPLKLAQAPLLKLRSQWVSLLMIEQFGPATHVPSSTKTRVESAVIVGSEVFCGATEHVGAVVVVVGGSVVVVGGSVVVVGGSVVVVGGSVVVVGASVVVAAVVVVTAVAQSIDFDSFVPPPLAADASSTVYTIQSAVRAVEGTRARITDTRKTTPGLRALEKYAVRCGGGINHRFGLDDAILIKDNHVAACGGVAAALRRAREVAGHLTPIEVEVDSLAQLEEALTFAPDVVMLDNFSLNDLRAAVALTAGLVRLEASGGVSLETVRAIAETGVDVISVGALTHSAPVLDIGLDAV